MHIRFFLCQTLVCAAFFSVSCKPTAPATRSTPSAAAVSSQTQSEKVGLPSLAKEGQAVLDSDISAIRPHSDNVPTKDELIAAIKREPVNLSGPQVALTLEVYNTLPLKTQQIIALLVNRGILHWEGDKLTDYKNQPTSLAMINDYISRLDLFLAAGLPEASTQTGNTLTDTNEYGTDFSTSTATEIAKASAFTPITILGIVVGFATALGTLIWGYREWSGGSKAIATEIAANARAAAQEVRFHNLETRISKLEPLKPGEKPTTAAKTETIDSKTGKPTKLGGNIINPGSSNHARFVFSPLLIATGLAVLGVTVYQVVNTAKQ